MVPKKKKIRHSQINIFQKKEKNGTYFIGFLGLKEVVKIFNIMPGTL